MEAQSVETGIGPTCSKKYGFSGRFKALNAKERADVSGMIHEAGFACEFDDYSEVLRLADEIEKLGFDTVAKRVRDRFLGIRMTIVKDLPVWGWDRERRREFKTGERADFVRLWTPYSLEFTTLRRSNWLKGRPCKEVTEHGKFHWDFEVSTSPLLMRVLVLAFPGRSYICDKGIFKVPTPTEFNKMFKGGKVPPIPSSAVKRIQDELADKAKKRAEAEAKFKSAS